MKLIIGLGNPGRGYAHNRHNAGFLCLAHLARRQGIRFSEKQAKARIGRGEIAGCPVVLAKPQTYMNQSGQSVSRLAEKFDVGPGDLIVIHDDLDLPLGKIRLRQGGSSGGHKGVSSIINGLGRPDFIRIRIGIGRPGAFDKDTEAAVIAHVLSDFTPEERQIIARAIPTASEAVYCLLAEGLAVAMNKYN